MSYKVNPLLAKLLAKEDITIQSGNYSSAWFDVKHRVLGLPNWKDMGKPNTLCFTSNQADE